MTVPSRLEENRVFKLENLSPVIADWCSERVAMQNLLVESQSLILPSSLPVAYRFAVL